MSGVLLEGLVLLPLALALGTWLARRRAVAAAGGLVVLGWSGWACLQVDTLRAVDVAWIGELGVRWHLGLDGVSAPFVLMSALVFALCLLATDDPRLASLLLLIEAGVLGAFVALDMVVFFVFFEVALIPMWFVVHGWGDPHDEPGRLRAATRFLVFTVLGSALMLVGFLVVRAEAGTFDIVAVAASYEPTGAAGVGAALLVALGLAVKTPLWPLHIWLPDAHSKAPTVGSVVLAAVLLKLGTYGLLRFWLPLADPGWPLLVPGVAAFATVGIVYAALACLAQTEIKRLVAYSSVGHMGFVALAAATWTVGGVQAAVYASVAHGLITGLLFFLAGAVKDRYGTGDLAELRALYGTVPRLAGVLAFAAMASLGLPGLAGFWGEVLAIRAALYPSDALPGSTYAVLAVVAAVGVVLTTAYFLMLVRRILQGEPEAVRPVNEDVPSIELATSEVDPGTTMAGAVRRDVTTREWVTWAPLVALTVLLGVAPGLLLTPVGEAAGAFFRGLA